MAREEVKQVIREAVAEVYERLTVATPGVPSYSEFVAGGMATSPDLIIPDGQETIAANVFANRSQAFSGEGDPVVLHIPDTVNYIGDAAFSALSLTNDDNTRFVLDMSEINPGITFGNDVFSQSHLKTVILPEVPDGAEPDEWLETTFGGKNMFQQALAYGEIEIPESWTVVPAELFQYEEDLNKLTIHDNLTALDASCFYSAGKNNNNICRVWLNQEDTSGSTFAFQNITDFGSNCFAGAAKISIGGENVSPDWQTGARFGEYCFNNCTFYKFNDVGEPTRFHFLPDGEFHPGFLGKECLSSASASEYLYAPEELLNLHTDQLDGWGDNTFKFRNIVEAEFHFYLEDNPSIDHIPDHTLYGSGNCRKLKVVEEQADPSGNIHIYIVKNALALFRNIEEVDLTGCPYCVDTTATSVTFNYWPQNGVIKIASGTLSDYQASGWNWLINNRNWTFVEV